MPVIKTTLRQLSEASVDYVSLVKRGANRIPFRVIKTEGEQPMLDLSNPLNLFRGKKAEAQEPEVVAVAVMASDDATLAQVQKTLADNGMAFKNTFKNEDGSITLTDAEDPTSLGADDNHLVRLSDNMCVVMKGFSAYATNLTENATFGEQVAAKGFYSNVYTANEVLSDTMRDALYSASSPSDAASEISKLLSAHNAYVLSLVKGLPVKAFKAEQEVTALYSAVAAKNAEGTATEAAQAATSEAEAGAEGEAATKTEPEAGVPSEEAKPAAEGTAEGNQDQVQKSEGDAGAAPAAAAVTAAPDAMVQVLQQLQELTKVVKSVSEKVDTTASEQEIQAKKIEEIARKSDTATQAVKTTVVVGAAAGDEPAQAPARKSDNDPRTGCFDTAFISAKKAR